MVNVSQCNKLADLCELGPNFGPCTLELVPFMQSEWQVALGSNIAHPRASCSLRNKAVQSTVSVEFFPYVLKNEGNSLHNQHQKMTVPRPMHCFDIPEWGKEVNRIRVPHQYSLMPPQHSYQRHMGGNWPWAQVKVQKGRVWSSHPNTLVFISHVHWGMGIAAWPKSSNYWLHRPHKVDKTPNDCHPSCIPVSLAKYPRLHCS